MAGDGRSSSVEAFDGPVVAPSTYGIVGDIRHGGDIVAVINVVVPEEIIVAFEVFATTYSATSTSPHLFKSPRSS